MHAGPGGPGLYLYSCSALTCAATARVVWVIAGSADRNRVKR